MEKIFSISTDIEFEQLALSIFNFQAVGNPVYASFLAGLKINPAHINSMAQIPFLPIEFFKSHKVVVEADGEYQVSGKSENKEEEKKSICFTSSGAIQSKHFVTDVSIYENSYLKGFDYFYGDVEQYCVLALLPNYLERDGSSLIYMAEDLIKSSKHPRSGFYLHNYDELISLLKQLDSENQKTILLGVTYALLDLIDIEKLSLKNTIIMETGGMKGKRKEMVREELHAVLCEGLGVEVIHSEYGMTELLSQSYSKGDGIFVCPPWMKIMIRAANDPFNFEPNGKSGGINVIDLANINSCSFIATQDLGKLYPDNSFEVLGRFDNSDVRGCNLLVG